MTIDTPSTDRTDWDRQLERFTALRLLYEADDQWGRLRAANDAAETAGSLVKMTEGAERAEWQAEYARARDQGERELARHMVTIYEPFIEAGMALVRTPAPDLAAVAVKHEACNADGFRLLDYEEHDGELFDIIRADVQRLTGICS